MTAIAREMAFRVVAKSVSPRATVSVGLALDHLDDNESRLATDNRLIKLGTSIGYRLTGAQKKHALSYLLAARRLLVAAQMDGLVVGSVDRWWWAGDQEDATTT